ncbi:MAG TPA: alpha/beta hydrolase [Candidatus Acidoferrales bacterium]|nr:alpha/beta hydrolase [Candidatus Acidoferrales bacterium]
MRGKMKFRLILLLAVIAVPASGQGQPADKTITVFGEAIHYFDMGSGPVVVLLHGLGSRKEDWLPVLEPMAQKFRLLVPDQIGFGRSDKPLLDYSIQTYVDFLNEFLRQLKVEKASLVGESLGGWIAGLYVAEIGGGAHLIPVEKLVLVDAAGLKQDKPIPDLNPSSLAAMRGLMEAVFYDTSWLNEDALRKIFTDKLAAHDGYTVRSLLGNPALGTERLDDRLASIKVPTLVAWGKQDKLLPIGAGERYAAGIAGAKLISFEKCGHVPPIEKTEEFVAAVVAFLGSSASAAH